MTNHTVELHKSGEAPQKMHNTLQIVEQTTCWHGAGDSSTNSLVGM